jgi:hypothetical protein
MHERLRAANKEIIGGFVNYAVEITKTGKRRVAKYASHLQFFSNEYLINYHEGDLLEGLECFPEFVGSWFIRKCMWSDEASLRENIEGFRAFLGYLEETEQIPKERIEELRQHIDKESHLYLLRVKYFNDPECDFDDILDECGWNDDALLSFEKQQAVMPEISKMDHFVLNLLLSAKAAKFFKFKPPEVIKLKDWSKSWNDPGHHWISSWRCEECFAMKGSKARIFMVTNEVTRFSFLLSFEPGDIKGLFRGIHEKIMVSLKKYKVNYPSRMQLQITTLSGAAPSLTTCQNNLIYYLDVVLERGEHKYLDDLEPKLNGYLTTINGSYEYPACEYERLCKEDSPFKPYESQDYISALLN